MPSSFASAHAQSASVSHHRQLSSESSSPSLTKRIVRLTFGSKNSEKRSPAFSSLPPSPSTSFDTDPLQTIASTSKMVMRHVTVSTPTIAEITSSIPLRTNSITPDTSAVYFPSPSTITSSPNNSIEGNPDRRTMPRANQLVSPNSTRPRAFSYSSSMTTTSTLPDCEKPLPPTPPPKLTSEPLPRTRRPSMVERAAFLSSAPVRSQITVAPKSKSVTPGSSAFATLSSPSLSLFPSSTLSVWSKGRCPLMSGGCCTGFNPERRRWSNDSSRALHGAVPELDTILKQKSDDDHDEYEDGDDACSSMTSYDYYNDLDNNEKWRPSAKTVESIKKQKMPTKKRCPTLTLFSFMMKK
ncbi:hypothetical protein BGZ58_003257 [Dissophora ornata]|nr:hypothetical protein BGZ58_003257 [Dissophora ornata]